MNTYRTNVPLVDPVKGHSPYGTTVAHDTDATWGAYLRPTTDTGNWIQGIALKARAGLVTCTLAAVAAGATDFKLSLLEAADANGTDAAEKKVLISLGNTALGTGGKVVEAEFEYFGVIDPAKFYALAPASKGATPASDGVPCSATWRHLDPYHSA